MAAKVQQSNTVLEKTDLTDILTQQMSLEDQINGQLGKKDEQRFATVGVKNIAMAKKNMQRMRLNPMSTIPVDEPKKPATKN